MKLPSALSAKIFISFFCRLNTILTSASLPSLLRKERSCHRQHVSPGPHSLCSTLESAVWCQQEAWAGYVGGLFSHFTDRQTEAVSVGPNTSAFRGQAGHTCVWSGSRVGTDQTEQHIPCQGLKLPDFLNLRRTSNLPCGHPSVTLGLNNLPNRALIISAGYGNQHVLKK